MKTLQKNKNLIKFGKIEKNYLETSNEIYSDYGIFQFLILEE